MSLLHRLARPDLSDTEEVWDFRLQDQEAISPIYVDSITSPAWELSPPME